MIAKKLFFKAHNTQYLQRKNNISTKRTGIARNKK